MSTGYPPALGPLCGWLQLRTPLSPRETFLSGTVLRAGQRTATILITPTLFPLPYWEEIFHLNPLLRKGRKQARGWQPSFSLVLCPLAAGFVLVLNSELIANYCETYVNRNFIRKERNLRLPTFSCSPDPLSFSTSVSGMVFLTLSVCLIANLSGHDWSATFSGKPSHPCCQGWLFPLLRSTQASFIFTEHLPMRTSFSLGFLYTPLL